MIHSTEPTGSAISTEIASSAFQAGSIIEVKGARVGADNGRFAIVLVTSYETFWKRLKADNAWSAGGNIARNLRGERMETLQAWLDTGIAQVTGSVSAEFIATR